MVAIWVSAEHRQAQHVVFQNSVIGNIARNKEHMQTAQKQNQAQIFMGIFPILIFEMEIKSNDHERYKNKKT